MRPVRHWKIGLAVTAAAAVTFMLPVPAAAATAANPGDLAPVVGADHANAIPGSYIVVLDDTADVRVMNDVAAQVRRSGGTVTRVYGTALTGFAAELDAGQLAQVRAQADVAYVEADQVVEAVGTQSPTPSWGLDRTDQLDLPLDNSYTYNATGSGVTAYVIDTGIYSGHNDFGGRVRSGFDAIRDGRGTEDCQGHGTHVAGTIGGSSYGLAKQVSLVAVRVLNCSGSGTTSGVIDGVNWVANNHQSPAVGNMSLGGGASQALDAAVNGAIDSGVTMAVAAGNDYGADACNTSPARTPAALTVASSTSTDTQSNFSNVGPCVDLYAPGSSITSAWIGGTSASNTISGTSMATPHVAGVAALYLSTYGSATPSQVAGAVVGNATPNTLTGVTGGTANLLLHYPADWSGGPGPDPDPDPTGCEGHAVITTGTLSGSGATSVQPSSGSFSSSGTISGCLAGPTGTDFDLYLQKRSWWGGWSTVASSLGWTSDESIDYQGSSGTYRFVVRSYSGSGEFTFGMTAS